MFYEGAPHGNVITLRDEDTYRDFVIDGNVGISGLTDGAGEPFITVKVDKTYGEAAAGATEHRVFTVADGGGLSLQNIILQGGYVQSGGAVNVMAGGDAVLDNVVVNASGAANGGAVANGDSSNGVSSAKTTLTVKNSLITGNYAYTNGGGVYNVPSGSGNTNVIYVDNSTFYDNYAQDDGGAAHQRGGNLCGERK